jgi:PPOX class probable F420-dependent enzyme
MPMSRAEVDAFLAERRLAHFATVDSDGRPRVRPVWYVWDDDAFWFTTRLEIRHTGTDITRGSTVAVSIASEERPYRAVLAHGRAEVWSTDREVWLRRISFRYGEREGRFWLRGAMKEPDRVVLRLVPDELIAWDYGKGDYKRMNAGESQRVDV